MKSTFLLLLVAFISITAISVKAQDKKGVDKIGICAGYQSANWCDKDGVRLGDPLNNFLYWAF